METANKQEKTSSGTPARVRIVIADDNPVERQYLQSLLGHAGYEVWEAANGNAALDLAHRHKPDLIISDILMPGLDGFELVRRLRSQPETASTRVIIWSATFRQQEAQTLSAALGVARFVVKPIEPQNLLAAVDAVLREPPPSPVPATVMARLEEAHQHLFSDKLVTKMGELEQEIAAHRQMEIMLRESERRFSGLIAAATDAIVSIDAGQCIVLFNAAAEAMFRCPASRAVGMPIEHFIPERFRAAHREYVRQFALAGTTSRAMGKSGAIWGQRTDGEEFPIEAAISKVQVGGQWQLTVILRDISERRQAEEALRRSQQALDLAVSGAALGIWNWDLRTGEVAWSERCCQLFGIPPGEQMSYERFLVALHPADRERTALAVRQALDAREEYNIEYRVVWPDGSIHWVVAVGRGVYDEVSSEAVGMNGIVADITRRKQTEEALRQQAMLLDLAPDPILVWESREGIMFWNNACQELYGFSRQEALGKKSYELLKTVFPVSLDACLSELAGTGQWVGELRHTTRDGRELVVASRMLRLEINGQEVTLQANRCITERKRLEDALKRVNQDLEQRVAKRTTELTQANEALLRSNQELQQFAFIASHDLQTPLRSIAGFAQLLQTDYRGRLDPHADELIDRVVDNARRLHRLIHDLLAYARVDSRAAPFKPIDFQQVFDDVVDTLAASIRDTGAEIGCGELPVVLGDQSQLTQLLQNLVENAIKYHGGQPPRVRVAAERLGREWVFSVRDNGIGIAPQHLQRIFEIFRRLHTQQAYPGTGIGLAICRRVVERHGGQIWVESEPGKGSVFLFSLPDSSASQALPLPRSDRQPFDLKRNSPQTMKLRGPDRRQTISPCRAPPFQSREGWIWIDRRLHREDRRADLG